MIGWILLHYTQQAFQYAPLTGHWIPHHIFHHRATLTKSRLFHYHAPSRKSFRILAPRISAESTTATTIPPSLNYPNCAITRINTTVKIKKTLLPNTRPLDKERDSYIEALVLIDITVLAAIVIAIVAVTIGEFLRGIAVTPVVSGLILIASTIDREIFSTTEHVKYLYRRITLPLARHKTVNKVSKIK